MSQENEKSLSLRVGSTKNSGNSLSLICKMYHLSFSIPKMFKYIFMLSVCLNWK